MNGFMKGVLVGIGIAWLVAPMRGKEMRRLVSERLQEAHLNERLREVRGYLPGNERWNQSVQQVTDSLSQTRNSLGEIGQLAVSNLNTSALSDLAQSAIKGLNGNALTDLGQLITLVVKRTS